MFTNTSGTLVVLGTVSSGESPFVSEKTAWQRNTQIPNHTHCAMSMCGGWEFSKNLEGEDRKKGGVYSGP